MSACCLIGCPLGKAGLGLLLIAGTVAAFGLMSEPEKNVEPVKVKAPPAASAPATATPETPKLVADPNAEKEPSSLFDFTLKNIDGETQPLSAYKGKVILVVNTASQCGYTPQYEGLQKLYTENKDKGLVILAFPSNDFGKQEPGSASEIKSFCQKNYGVTFPVFEKIIVSGPSPHPLYKWLAAQKAGGPMTPKWNFSKYLVDSNGQVVAGYASKVKPDDKELAAKIEELLAKTPKAPKPTTVKPTPVPAVDPKTPTDKK